MSVFRFIEAQKATFPISLCCRMLGVPVSRSHVKDKLILCCWGRDRLVRTQDLELSRGIREAEDHAVVAIVILK